jgi:hypothetical protein
LEKEVCFADSNLVWGRQRPQTITRPGYYTDTISNATIHGCDSVYILHVTEVTAVDAELIIPPAVCADDPSLSINLLPLTNPGKVQATNYSVEFDAYSRSAGFSDYSGIIDPTSNIIDVPLPTTIYPDSYQFTIHFTDSVNNCGVTSITHKFDVYYPDTIFHQKWDNVIAIKNKYYNGGFEFSRYQWYRNGAEIPGATGSYINTSLIPGDNYSAMLTRLNGTQMMSCQFTAKASNPDITINPTIISANNFVKIYIERGGALVNIWNVMGLLIQQVSINAPQQSINAPAVEGTYIIEVITDSGQRKVQPLVVTR